MRERRGMSGFAKGLLIYILVFLLLAAAALFVLRLYLQAYEESRSGTCIQQYLFSCLEGERDADWEACLDGLDERIQTREDGLAFIRAKIASAERRELLSENKDEKRYALLDEDGLCFAELTMRQSDKEHWGFRGWEVVDVDCELSGYVHSYSATVPTDCRLFLGETELDERFIVERDIPYEILAPCRELVPRLPTMVRYELGPTLDAGPLRICNALAQEIPEEKQNERGYLANCSSTTIERLEEFSLRYLNAYLPYAGDLYHSGFSFWADLSEMIVRHGELEDRLVAARSGFGFGNTRSIEIVDHTVNLCVDFKDGHYLVDILYRTETVGLQGPVQEDNRVRLLLWEENERLFAEAMYHY